ncbi:Bax inhibitor-1/YccA family protein [Arachidicoccus ginsenosidivorans]
MTIGGSIGKFGFLLLMVMGGAFYTWNLLGKGQTSLLHTMMMVGLFGGLITAMIIIFKPQLAKYIAPLYALLEGFALGGISVVVQAAFAEKYPGIVLQAVGLTFAVALGMLALYGFRVIRATQKFRSIIFSATLGIMLFYLITWVLSLFHVNVAFMYDSSLLGIGVSIFIVAIAALNLILDFDMIERGAEMGAPKYMEWYGAFGLMITMVWLYLEILKLLSRFAGRK